MRRLNTCENWYRLQSHPEHSGNPVRYYCRCQCLGSSHMVIDCAFSVAAPTLWNRLPENIRNASSLETFKSVLKMHLFKVAFTDQ